MRVAIKWHVSTRPLPWLLHKTHHDTFGALDTLTNTLATEAVPYLTMPHALLFISTHTIINTYTHKQGICTNIWLYKECVILCLSFREKYVWTIPATLSSAVPQTVCMCVNTSEGVSSFKLFLSHIHSRVRDWVCEVGDREGARPRVAENTRCVK